MHGAEAQKAPAQRWDELLERGSHVDEAGRPSAARGERACVEHRRRGRTLRVRIVGVEELEETGAHGVAAERDVAELRAELVGQHEAGVDDLALFGVAQRAAVARASDRVFDRADERGQLAQLRVLERRRKAHHADPVLREQFGQLRTRRGVPAVDLERVEDHWHGATPLPRVRRPTPGTVARAQRTPRG